MNKAATCVCLAINSRICRLCHTGALGDERHMLLECFALLDLRAKVYRLISDILSNQNGWLLGMM